MFVVGNVGDDVNEYTLSTGFDVSTASFVDSFSVSAQDTSPYGIAFNADGTRMYVVGRADNDVNEYTLSTGFDVSTASYVQNFSAFPQNGNFHGLAFNANGTKMYLAEVDSDSIYEYTITPYAGVSISESSVSVTEGLATSTYTIVLESQPDSSVVVTPSASSSEVTLSPSSLTFTTGNWNTPQTVTVTAVDDTDSEFAHTDTITHSASSSDSNYNGISINSVTANITDNDSVEVSIAVGADDGYRYSGFSSSADSGLLGSNGSYNDNWFRFTNINIPQGSTITSATMELYVTWKYTYSGGTTAYTDIFAVDEDNHVAPTTAGEYDTDHANKTSASTAWDFAVQNVGTKLTTSNFASSVEEVIGRSGWSSGNAIGIHIDDGPTPSNTAANRFATYENTTYDPPKLKIAYTLPYGVTLSSTTSTATEGGATSTYTVVLDYAPSANVDISLSNDNSQATTTPSSLTFTTGNYDTPQTVTVSAIDDLVDEDTATSTISHTASSSDSNYNSISISSNVVTITDNDTAGVTVTESTGSTDVVEGATTDTYTIVLDTKPTASVTITPSSDSQATTSPATLTYTTSNWNTPQTVTVTPIDDGPGEGAHTGTITHSASSSDTKYNSISISSVTANISEDSDAPNISSISATPSSTSATITWTTDEQSSTQVSYGLTNLYGTNTTKTDTSPRVTSHSASLTDLVSCTTYHFLVSSEDAASNTATSSDQTFDTTSCTGSASITGKSDNTSVTTASGGSLSLTSGTANLGLTVPAGFSTTDANFQIKQLNKDTLITAIGSPTSKQLIGSHTYDLKALENSTTTISSFSNSISITITYQDSDISGLDETSLAIYRYDGSSWQKLSGCTVNPAANTVTCSTTTFSTFGLFGSQAASGGSSGTSVQGRVQNLLEMGKEQQAKELMNQWPHLFKQELQTQTSHSFTRNLTIGSTGPDVLSLQQYLNNSGFPLAQSGPGSKGQETSYFGELTRQALIRLQNKYASQILTPLGLTSGTGYFGPSTRTFIGGNTSIPAPTPTPQIQTQTIQSSLPPAGLYPGSRGPEVLLLQQLLNQTEFKVSESNEGSPGQETDVYGELTTKAIQRFQLHYNIVPDENTPGYGVFGPKTRVKLGEVLD